MKPNELTRAETMIPNECPNCGSKNVTSRISIDRFQYGNGPDAVQLEANIPFRRCNDCAFEYTDSEAEDIRHEAVCRHLGVMVPAEVLEIRISYGLTRAEFAEATRIGEASLGRWETGQLIQNPANDNYLYLLKFRENWERLKARFKRALADKPNVLEMPRHFQYLDAVSVDRKREEGRGFLRSAVG
jgi:DNA-binding transcriptional regulator YiaG